jgi:hypothetical protein
MERLFGPTFKIDLGSDTPLPLQEATKTAKGFGKHAFEGGGYAFSRKKEARKCLPTEASLL